MAKPIVCNLFNSLNTPRLNTEMGKPIFFDLGIGIIGFFCFAFRYRYFTVFRYFGKMSVPITSQTPHKERERDGIYTGLLDSGSEVESRDCGL